MSRAAPIWRKLIRSGRVIIIIITASRGKLSVFDRKIAIKSSCRNSSHHREQEAKEKLRPVVSHQDSPPKFEELHEENKEKVPGNPFHKFGKTGFLVVVWIFMVMFLTSTPEKVLDRRQLAVPIAEPRIFTFPKLPSGTRINSTFSGAFNINETKIEHQQKAKKTSMDFINKKVNETIKENYIRVYLQTDEGRALTHPKIFAVTPPSEFDTTKPVRIPVMFDIGEDNLVDLLENSLGLQLYVESNFTKTPDREKQEMPLIFTYDIAPINRQLGVIFAAFVLIFLYALIIYEVSLLLSRCLERRTCISLLNMELKVNNLCVHAPHKT